MSLYATLEPVLVGLIICASFAFALRRLAPRLLARILGKIPAAPTGCDSGCGSCNSCGPTQVANPQLIRVHHNKSKAA